MPAFLAREISRNTYLNPMYRADEYPELDRQVTAAEYRDALASAARHGLRRLDRRH